MRRFLTAAAIAALLAVVAAEAYRWLLGGSHLGLLAVVFVACLASGLAAMRIGRSARARGARSRGARSRGSRSQGSRGGRSRAPAARPQPARPAVDGPRETGTVKWFSRSKGFGFVIREDGDEIFVHHRSIRSDGDRRGNLRDGQRVTFVAVERSKGWQAEDVSPEGD